MKFVAASIGFLAAGAIGVMGALYAQPVFGFFAVLLAMASCTAAGG